MQRIFRIALPVVAASTLLLAGCGSQYPVAPVGGVVTVDGKPQGAGRVMFAPVGEGETGPVSFANVQSDGTYQMTTYAEGDGAVVGKHIVRFLPPIKPDEETDLDPSADPMAGFIPFQSPQEMTFEVKSAGDNKFDIQLEPRKRKRRGDSEEDDD